MERFIERGEEKTQTAIPWEAWAHSTAQPTSAWDAQDNMFISDGYGNLALCQRSTKAKRNWQKAVGTHGSGDNQFSTPHGISTDA